MAVYRRQGRSRFTLLLLVLTSITLLTLDYRGADAGILDKVKDAARDAFAPVQDASDAVFEPVGNFVGGILHYGDLKAENRRLREENAAMRGAVLRADDAEFERQQLLDLMDLGFVDDIPRVNARVVTMSPSNFDLTVEIDKGTNDGVARGMPVVTGAGLVGRVLDVSRTRAVVQLLTEETFSVGVRMSATGDVGVANGQGLNRPLTVDLIDPATKVDKGEVVVTSGLQQSQFPAGVPVGTVERATKRENALQQDIEIEPVVDLRRLAFVAVLQWSGA